MFILLGTQFQAAGAAILVRLFVAGLITFGDPLAFKNPLDSDMFIWGLVLTAIGGRMMVSHYCNPKKEFTVLHTYVREDGTSGMLVQYKDGTEENRNV